MNKTLLRRLFWILLATPYFTPALFGVLEGTEWLETAFDLWRMAAAGVIAVKYLYELLRYRRLPSKVLLCLVGYLFFVSLATVVRASNYWALLNHVATIITFCMLLELSLRADPEYTMDMLFYPLTVLILANFVLLLLYPDGICTGGTYNYSYNLMGIDNLLAPVLIPYMFLVALRSTMQSGDLDWVAYVMIGVSSLTLLLVWSATGLMGLAVALVFLLFFYQRRWQTLFNGVTSMAAGFGLFFSVVLFRLQNLFSFLIEGVLHKGLSFTGRTDIWDTAISLFLASPFLGYGYAQSGKVYRLRKGKYYHAHNVFLELLMEGGVFALLCFLLMLGFSANQLMRHRKHPYACLISAGIMAAAVMTTMEPFLDSNGLLIYALVFLGYHVETLISHTTAKNSLSIS
jgi:O-antigen ligase